MVAAREERRLAEVAGLEERRSLAEVAITAIREARRLLEVSITKLYNFPLKIVFWTYEVLEFTLFIYLFLPIV